VGTRTPVRNLPEGAIQGTLEELRGAIERADRDIASLGHSTPEALREADRAGIAVARLRETQRELERATVELHEAQRRMAEAVKAWRTQVREVQRHLATADARTSDPARRSSPGVGVMAPRPRGTTLPPLSITSFGRFEVRRGGTAVRLCTSKSGQAILRYLATHPQRRESMDGLMDLFWPGDPPKAARHKLHIAFSALRSSLAPEPGSIVGTEPGYVRYADGAYELNPAAPITIDLEVFFAGYRAGQRAGMPDGLPHYESACSVVTGPFLPDDLYADWAIFRREAVTSAFQTMAHTLAEHRATTGRLDEAADWANRLLAENRTDEAAHRLLMRIHVRNGRRAEALRQYQVCVRALSEDLGIGPMAETTRLYQGIVDGRADAESPLLERP
jgi:DNA-binding SARP family transcriptional activator